MATGVGFMGGHTLNPTYKEVCYERTGHAEVVQVAFDPKVVSYAELLNIFWHLHDPTTLNRQGPDIGDQYRSAIYYHSSDQKNAAINSRDTIQGELKNKIVTEITPASDFYPAEDYHQQYVEKGGYAACHISR
jgi:peptide-methionine (S)-S-oxide reductase